MKICVFLIIYYTCDTRKKVKKGMYIYDLLVVKGTYFNRALNSRTQLNGKRKTIKLMETCVCEHISKKLLIAL